MFTVVAIAILVAVVFAPLGCLCLWKKYIYFTDGFAHASILVSAISIIYNIPLIYSGIVFAILFAIAIFKYKDIIDGNVGVCLISSFCLSLALIVSYISPVHIDVDALLFGDIVAVSSQDIIILSGILSLVVIFILIFYQHIVVILINRDIACIMRIRVWLIELLFLILLSLSVFTTMKIVGALMVIAMLLIPAITARIFATTPKQMIVFSIIISIMLNVIALTVSFYLDMPMAPLVTCIGTCIYFMIRVVHDLYIKICNKM